MVQFASYLRRVLCKTRLIFPRINGPIVNGWIQSLRAAGIFNHKSVGASLLFGNLRYQTQRLSHSRYLGRHAMFQRELYVTTLITPAMLTQETRVIGAKPFAVKCLFQSWPHRVAHATKNKKENNLENRATHKNNQIKVLIGCASLTGLRLNKQYQPASSHVELLTLLQLEVPQSHSCNHSANDIIVALLSRAILLKITPLPFTFVYNYKHTLASCTFVYSRLLKGRVQQSATKRSF